MLLDVCCEAGPVSWSGRYQLKVKAEHFGSFHPPPDAECSPQTHKDEQETCIGPLQRYEVI